MVNAETSHETYQGQLWNLRLTSVGQYGKETKLNLSTRFLKKHSQFKRQEHKQTRLVVKVSSSVTPTNMLAGTFRKKNDDNIS